MDMNYMMKLAKRNNLKADHLREDVVKEATTIIKLRVAQGFAFCDLKENYEQLENNHERLHHNMLEVQMQQEDISGQLQEELRLRPQTLNKVKYTRNLCETLEQCCSRLQDTLGRCQADQAMLYRIYESSEKTLLDSRQNQERKDQQYKLEISALNDHLKLLKEEKCNIEKELLNEKQQSIDTKCTLQIKAEKIIQLKDQMTEVINKMSNTIDIQNEQIAQKDENIKKMKEDVKQLIYECEGEGIILKKELKACVETKNTLQISLNKSIENSKCLMNKINEQEKALASLQAEKLQLQKQNSLLNDTCVECQTNESNKQQEIMNLNEELKNMNLNNKELNKQIQNFESTVKNMAKNNEDLNVNNEKLSKELCACKEDLGVKICTINELNALNDELTSKISQLQENGKNSDEKIEQLMMVIDTKQKELQQQRANVNTLMNDVKNITDANSRLEEVLKVKTKTYEDKIAQYMDDLKDKDQKLENNFKILVEIRAEKTVLLEKVTSLEKTIGNIHKQVAPQRKVMHVAESDSPHVPTQQCGRGSSNRDNTKSDQRQQPSGERSFPHVDKLPILKIFSNNDEDASQAWTFDCLPPIKRRRQQEMVAQTQPPANTYNPYSSMNIDTERTTFNERVEKPRTFFKTKRNQTRAKKI